MHPDTFQGLCFLVGLCAETTKDKKTKDMLNIGFEILADGGNKNDILKLYNNINK
jgi:hypothetical protein